MLAKRLTGRGVALSGGALAAVLAQQAASAGVPYPVLDSTIKAASLLAAGKAAAAGAISVKVAALTEGVIKAMLFTKLKAAIAVVLILGVVVAGATILTCRTAAGQEDKKPAAEKPVEPAAKQEKEKEIFTAWGKEVGGLQAGLGYRPGQKRAYSHGETVTLVVRVRNVGKQDVKFRYFKEFFMEKPPTVTGGEGKTIRLGGVDFFHVDIPVDVNLTPGKDMELHDLKIKLAPAGGSGDVTEVSPETLNGKGKFQIQYEQLAAASIDPILSKLATGKLELEVKEAEKGGKEQKETFTAWGKEVGGLQAGLGFRPGQKRAYSHGETVAVVLRVRNVGKEAVEFKHISAFFVENLPTIMDADGKLVQLPRFHADGRQLPRSTNVAPGKEVVLYEWSFDLRPKGDSGNKGSLTIQGTGKFSLQCERIVGPTSGNPNHPNPTLDKLATGKLELEVKDAKKLPKKGEKEGFTAWGKEVNGVQAGAFAPANIGLTSPARPGQKVQTTGLGWPLRRPTL